MGGAPGHPNWYECSQGKCPDSPRGARYEYPLPKVDNAPVPSQANYDKKNVAWLIELMAETTGNDKSEMQFRYENNTPDDPSDDIFVSHPNDKDYLPDKRKPGEKSDEQKYYEEKAKKSALLSLYEEYSPAKIKFFQ